MKPATLKQERDARDMTAVEFAELLGYGGSSNTKRKLIYDWEHGRRPIPNRVELTLLKLNQEGQ
jgi:DNA-binding transcriptional regulator YiaG